MLHSNNPECIKLLPDIMGNDISSLQLKIKHGSCTHTPQLLQRGNQRQYDIAHVGTSTTFSVHRITQSLM